MTYERGAADEALPCIWAEAGVLSYRLCDRRYECEQCPLFTALSGGRGAALPAGRGVHLAQPFGTNRGAHAPFSWSASG